MTSNDSKISDTREKTREKSVAMAMATTGGARVGPGGREEEKEVEEEILYSLYVSGISCISECNDNQVLWLGLSKRAELGTSLHS